MVGIGDPQVAGLEGHLPGTINQFAAAIVGDDYVRGGLFIGGKRLESSQLELRDIAVITRVARAIGDPLVIGTVKVNARGIAAQR